MKLMNDDLAVVFKALNGQACFVGGAVRDCLLGIPFHDVDVATPLLPQRVMQLLTQSGIRVIPTGLKHGTVTAIVAGRPVEITSLRKDVMTDGRHARVVFGADYREDALRRDFTINALYQTAKGQLLDYVGGCADLKAHRVRFIGQPIQRIQEDYLRILRYFRFWSRFDTHKMPEDIIRLLKREKVGLFHVSVERKTDEFLKILMTPRVIEVLQIMRRTGILPLLVRRARIEKLSAFLTLCPSANVLQRLAVLGGKTHLLRLSNQQKRGVLSCCGERFPKTQTGWFLLQLRTDADTFRFWVYYALLQKKITRTQGNQLLSIPMPVFPVDKKDLIDAGVRDYRRLDELMMYGKKCFAHANGQMKKTLVLSKILAYNQRKTNQGDKHDSKTK